MKILVICSIGLLLLFFGIAWINGMQPVAGLVYLLSPQPAVPERAYALRTIASQRISWIANIENRTLSESSGLTASEIQPGIFWSINDSGNAPQLFAFDETGANRGVWTLQGSRIVDWEAMDGFVDEAGQAFLVIGDVGDNLHWRPSLHIYVVPEPILSTNSASIEQSIESAWDFSFRLPGGAMDIEALAVDQVEKRILLMTKRTQPPRIYAIPLHPNQLENRKKPDVAPDEHTALPPLRTSQDIFAQHVADLPHIPTPTALDKAQSPREWRTRHMPSGMDISDGRLLVATYTDAYLYQLNALSTPPLRVPLPSVGQREAISFAPGSGTIAYTTRERPGGVGVSDLYRIELFEPFKFHKHEAERQAE